MQERWGRREEKERNKEGKTNRVTDEHGLRAAGILGTHFHHIRCLELYQQTICAQLTES